MPAAILGPIAGSVVGGLMGGDSGGEQQTNTKEPWEPARKPLINSLNTGQDLERYYQQTPFNSLQQQGYQNLYSDLDQYRNQVQPGLMNFANQMMTSNYQRGPRNSQVEAMQSQPMQGSTRPQMMQKGPDGSYSPQGLLSAVGGSQMGTASPNMSAMSYAQGGQGAQGLLAPQGVFQAPASGSYGLLDAARFRNELNPFTAANGIPKAPETVAAPVAEVDPANKPYNWRDDYERILRGQMNYTGSGA